jgi:ketosteroid isomerase-like protein
VEPTAIVERLFRAIERAIVDGESVAVEARWSGRLAVDAPPLGLRAGDTMTARFAQFVDVRDGRVVRHVTYDCFDPWEELLARAPDVEGSAEVDF